MKSKMSSKNSLLWGVVALVLGLIIAFNPNGTLELVIKLLGILMLVMGGVELITFLINKEKKQLKWDFSSFGAIIAIIFGLVLILRPEILTTAVMFILGAVVAMLGVWQIIVLSKLKKAGANVTTTYYIYPVILSLAGIAMLFFPKESSEVFVMVTGLLIASFGVSEILLSVMIKTPIIEEKIER